ncbi:molybdopterin-synthase adenylyltransferase MoeB [Pectobacterium cacticida]|uniref:Molybdopterin-synthase adenylyltransferase MoeB n=1 Tax=Pectobacterium cacticida TaxID=69221 RepID=A0ABZ2G8R7_9GAMM|nr:molybdopterin-synthase adenylyltransferase MoeB [Pectobacterium cacticida]UYX08024.1 molybdopterin-synthase adenylyltransferase MoeB [Pectobacterium cacticida]
MLPELSDEEMLRYNRQIVLRGFDFDGQERLKASRLLIVGLGGLGCAAAQYLAAAGVGHLTLLDFDTVSRSNLQRQVLHRDSRIGMAKVESARLTLAEMNPHLTLDTVNDDVDDDTLSELVSRHDAVLDCTDNVAIRNRLNRIGFQRQKPLISGAAIRMEGQLCVFTYQPDEPCYHCLSRLFGDNALTCVEAGVMSPLVGTIGSLQALEAIKLLTGYGKVITGRVLLFDAMTLQFRAITLPKNPHCDVCGG